MLKLLAAQSVNLTAAQLATVVADAGVEYLAPDSPVVASAAAKSTPTATLIATAARQFSAASLVTSFPRIDNAALPGRGA